MNARVVYTFKNLTAINFFSIDEKTKLLRNVSDHELYEKDNITKFFVDKKIIFYTLGRNVLCIYKFLNGTIDRI